LSRPCVRLAACPKNGQTEHVYGEFRYKTKTTWKYKRRILYKAEVTRHANRDPKDNPRFVVTNMKQSPQWLYEKVYCQRGDLENRIKELHYGMEIGRTSCTSFWANQFRVLMTAAAYVLMQELRLRLARTDCARAQVSTLRQRFLKIGVQVIASVRRVVLHLPQAFPYRDHFHRLALSLGAQTGCVLPQRYPGNFYPSSVNSRCLFSRQNLTANLANSPRISLSVQPNPSLVAYLFTVSKNSPRGQLSRIMRASPFPEFKLTSTLFGRSRPAADASREAVER